MDENNFYSDICGNVSETITINTYMNEEERQKQIKILKDERVAFCRQLENIDVQIEQLEKSIRSQPEKETSFSESNGDDHKRERHYLPMNSVVLGKSNIAAMKALELTMGSSGRQNNPFVLFGESGSGKTNLARLCASQAEERGLSVVYLSSDVFCNQLVSALCSQTLGTFRDDLLECDLLVIDDLPYFVGRFGCQDELCIILDRRISASKQVILTSVIRPENLEWQNKQLAARLSSGLSIELGLADTSMQLQILEQKLQNAGIRITQEALAEAVKDTNGNGWRIEGVAKQIIERTRQRGDAGRYDMGSLG